jgi:hypothetical protein
VCSFPFLKNILESKDAEFTLHETEPGGQKHFLQLSLQPILLFVLEASAQLFFPTKKMRVQKQNVSCCF